MMRPPLLRLLVLLLLLFPAQRGFCASNWDVIPAIHTVNEIIRIDNTLWGATNSGLLRYNLETEQFRVFTTADGLSSMQIDVMVADDLGNLILGMDNVFVDIFNLSTNQVTTISHFTFNSKIFGFYAICNHEGEIFLGTDLGVSRLVFYPDLGEYLVQANYQTLGDFPTETAARCIEVYDGGLWVGTDLGLARGDLSLPVLEPPESWTNFTDSDGLATDEIGAMEVFHDTLYVNTIGGDYGLNRLLNLADGFENLDVRYAGDANFMRAFNDTLYIGRYNGIYRLEGDRSARMGDPGAEGLSVTFASDGTPWGALKVKKLTETNTVMGGIKKWDGAEWILHAPEGALVETITDVFVEDDGSLWVTGQLNLGYTNGSLCHFDGQHWTNLGRFLENYDLNTAVSPDSFFWKWTRKIAQDQKGQVWIASDGRGAGWFDFVRDTTIQVGDEIVTVDTVIARGYFSDPSGKLYSAAEGIHHCVVRDLTSDQWGNIWICNSEADPALSGYKPLAIVPSDFIEDPVTFFNWDYLAVKQENGVLLPDGEAYIDRIAIDSYGRKWFGGNNNSGDDKGIWVLDDGGTPGSDEDDQWTHITGLPSDSITTIARDRDGIMWVGTPSGVQYFYPEENPALYSGRAVDLYGLPLGAGVNVIAVDPQNNKWFGTNQGISILGSDNFTWLDSYTNWEGSFPSPLPGNVVQAIEFNPRTGEAYLGTDRGLAVLNTPYKQMGQKVTDVSIITNTNPFLVGDGYSERLYFDAAGLSETAEMKIFTAAGYLVRKLEKNEILQGWDGRNDRGELVGSGVYLLLAYDPDGNSEVGKVAVIHK